MGNCLGVSVDTEEVPVKGGGSKTISKKSQDGNIPRTTSASGTVDGVGSTRSKGGSYKEPGSSTASFGINRSDAGGSSRTDIGNDGSIGASGKGNTEGSAPPVEDAKVRKLKLREVAMMCDNFASKRVLGEGSFGKVYKGSSPELGDVAIKVLDDDSSQGWDEWVAEVIILDKMRHPGLVRLAGYGKEKTSCYLVYHLAHNGNLRDALFNWKKKGKQQGSVLPWHRRVAIAYQVADALAYLHDNHVVHRDLKPSNILLDANYHALIADFGMAKESGGQTHVSTRVMGSMGYLDPAYLETGQLRMSSDIYSFGIILLELITGKPAAAENTQPLVQWVWPIIAQKRPDVDLLVDPQLDGRYVKDVAMVMTIVAKFCVGEAASRPAIDVVKERLKQALIKQEAADAVPSSS